MASVGELVVNSVPLRPVVLDVQVTRRCNARCTMCITESGPDVREELPLDILVSVVHQAADEGFHAVSFTGGEPCLFLDRVAAGVQAASGRGLSSSVVTNGFWAVTRERATDVCRTMVDAGLNSITISTDAFHRPYISDRRVDAAIEASVAAGLDVTVNCVAAAESDGTAERSDLFRRLAHVGAADRVAVFPMLPVGRAGSLPVRSKPGISSSVAAFNRCTTVVSTFMVLANGDFYACCGIGGFTPELRIGSVSEMSLGAAVRAAERKSSLRALALHGPMWIREQAGLDDLGFSNECDACHATFSRSEDATAARTATSDGRTLLDLEYDYLSLRNTCE